jgi:SH3 domain-containing YSC84-like protein 1
MARNYPVTVGMVLAMGVTVGLRADPERLKSAETVLTEMAAATEMGISPDLLKKAQCLVIIPSVRKAALGIGGQYGRGYFSCRRGGGWSAPSAMRIEGGSVGFQIGGSATDVIMLVMKESGVERLLSSKFTLGADAAVAAGPVGRQSQAQTDITLKAEILAWSRSRGAFAGVALDGATLREDSSENAQMYGREITNRDVFTGKVAAPASAAGLMKALGKY